MVQINKSKPVLVTGANGYVASWLVKKLLEEGFTVHAAVRNPDNHQKIAHLKNLASHSNAKIKFFASDLLKSGSYKAAMEGCELVFHTASPYTLDVKDPQKELIDPAVNGTENVLLTANEVESVKRVVLTSSCAAIYTDAIDTINAPGGRLTEDVWNTTASIDYQPYSLSKTLAEKKAWEIASHQNRWDLVVINMPGVFGPPLNPKYATSESINILKMFADGQLKFGAPRMGIGVVDVRDGAYAHLKAGLTPEAKGRYICSAHETDLIQMAEALMPEFNNYPLPKKATPKWLLLLIGPLVNKLFTKRFIRNNVNIPWKADNSKIKKELGMNFRSLKETMQDSFKVLIDEGVIKKK